MTREEAHTQLEKIILGYYNTIEIKLKALQLMAEIEGWGLKKSGSVGEMDDATSLLRK